MKMDKDLFGTAVMTIVAAVLGIFLWGYHGLRYGRQQSCESIMPKTTL